MKKTVLLLIAVLLVQVFVLSTAQSLENQLIDINVPAFSIRLFNGDNMAGEWRCRVGKLETRTIIGTGIVSKKFSPAWFRFSEGEKAGEIIEYSRIRKYYQGPVLETIKIPYVESIRGLELKINGRVSGQIIHSTTNPETVGHVYSNGCLGMYVDDMLEIYGKTNMGAKVTVRYDLLEFDGKIFVFHRDIYGNNPQILPELEKMVVATGLPLTKTMVDKLLTQGLSEGRVELKTFLTDIAEL